MPGLWAPAVGMQPTEIVAAKDDQRAPARDLGTNQSSTAVERGRRGWRTALSYGWTVQTASPIHEPSDISLLWDAVRVMVRLLKQADVLVGGADLAWYVARVRIATSTRSPTA
jgi:hypothetical protein